MENSNFTRFTGKIIKILTVCAVLSVVGIGVILLIDWYVQQTSAAYIVEPSDAPESDVILVLGAYVFPDGAVSIMLGDRLEEAYELYKDGKAGKLLVSGDHGQNDYNEVAAMKKFLTDKDIPEKDVFMDHAGFNTYESIYRARNVFLAQRIIIVTQGYHLKRAVFVARELGLDAYGVASDRQDYGEVMIVYQWREAMARNKDFLLAKFLKPQPTFLGETIPVSGDGRATND